MESSGARTRHVLWRLGAWLVVAAGGGGLGGCTHYATGELGDALCSNNEDDDRDQRWDCDDPDCWSSDACSGALAITQGMLDASLRIAPDAEEDPEVDDTETPALLDDDDAGTLEPDATTPTAPTCGPAGVTCKRNEECRSGECVILVEDGVYLVRIASAVLPDRRLNTAAGLCFDTLLEGCAGAVLLCDQCKPDPYVITELAGDEIDRTMPNTDTTAPTWREAPFVVAPKAGQTLRLRVMDSDPRGPIDTTIFWCDLDITRPGASGGLQCIPDPNQTIAGDFKVTVEVTPKPRAL